jgi:hypothetical protein
LTAIEEVWIGELVRKVVRLGLSNLMAAECVFFEDSGTDVSQP